jgi:hypothetical protein
MLSPSKLQSLRAVTEAYEHEHEQLYVRTTVNNIERELHKGGNTNHIYVESQLQALIRMANKEGGHPANLLRSERDRIEGLVASWVSHPTQSLPLHENAAATVLEFLPKRDYLLAMLQNPSITMAFAKEILDRADREGWGNKALATYQHNIAYAMNVMEKPEDRTAVDHIGGKEQAFTFHKLYDLVYARESDSITRTISEDETLGNDWRNEDDSKYTYDYENPPTEEIQHPGIYALSLLLEKVLDGGALLMRGEGHTHAQFRSPNRSTIPWMSDYKLKEKVLQRADESIDIGAVTELLDKLIAGDFSVTDRGSAQKAFVDHVWTRYRSTSYD